MILKTTSYLGNIKLMLAIGFKTTFLPLLLGAVLAGCQTQGTAKLPNDSFSPTLEAVKQRGALNCGITTGLPGWAAKDKEGIWQGFDIDACRAVAASIFNDPEKVNYITTTSKSRFVTLLSGDVDMLARNVTLTFTRTTKLGMKSAGINLQDGQGFMVSKQSGINVPNQLGGKVICVPADGKYKQVAETYFKKEKLEVSIVPYKGFPLENLAVALEDGSCDAISLDRSALMYVRLDLESPQDYQTLNTMISSEPLSLMVRSGDKQWQSIVNWTLNALLTAEELGVNSSNLDTFAKTENPQISFLLGTEKGSGESLGLNDLWAYNVISHLGNYGEIYDRHFGPKSGLLLERGPNELVKNGGLMIPLPMR